MILQNKKMPVNASGGLLPMRPGYRRNTGFPSAYPVPKSTPFADFGRNILDAFSYTPDPNTTYMERVGKNLAGDMESMISGFDAKGNKVPDSLRMMSLMMPGGTGLGGKAGVGILGAATGASPKVGSAYASRLMPALENMPQEKMSADQFSGWLSKQPVGSDELEYSGIPGLLAQGGDVTKTGLLDQARANPLDIQDVIKSEPYREITKRGNEFQVEADDGYFGPFQTRQEAEEIITELRETGAYGGPKFSDYQLPGGEDYKEMLLTLPEKRMVEGLPIYEDNGRFYVQKLDRPMPEHDRSYKTMEAANDAALSTVGRGKRTVPVPGQTFKGGHFDEPNVLAHARYNTRTIDGDKTLFVEEIQSDWHQKGRDVGYNIPDKDGYTAEQVEQMRQQVRDERNRIYAEFDAGQITREQRNDALDNTEEIILEANRAENIYQTAVPDAPYKRTDKWAGLTLQRMVKEAVDSGHDRIAWTPGKVQAERYDLSKRVGEITYEPNSKQLYVYGKIENYDDDFSPFISEIVEPENLADFIGKEASERLLASRQAKFTQGGPDGIVEKKHHLIKGKDLEIGGEGMKEFYDKMLVKSANKFGKKYGAKAKPTMMDNNEVWSMKITPEMKAGISKGVMLGKTGGEGKIGAGLLQNQNEQEQMLDDAPPIKSSLFGTMYGGGYI